MTTRDKILQFISSNFYASNTQTLDDNTSFLDTGIIDSTGVLEIVGFLERDFQLQIHDHEVVPENLDTIVGIMKFIEQKQAQ